MCACLCPYKFVCLCYSHKLGVELVNAFIDLVSVCVGEESVCICQGERAGTYVCVCA